MTWTECHLSRKLQNPRARWFSLVRRSKLLGSKMKICQRLKFSKKNPIRKWKKCQRLFTSFKINWQIRQMRSHLLTRKWTWSSSTRTTLWRLTRNTTQQKAGITAGTFLTCSIRTAMIPDNLNRNNCTLQRETYIL